MFRNEFLVKNHDEWFSFTFFGKSCENEIFYLKFIEDKQRTET